MACPVLVKTGLKEYFGWTIVPSVSMYPGHVLTSFFAHEDYMHQAAMASQDFYCCWLLEGESHTCGPRCNAQCFSPDISPSLQMGKPFQGLFPICAGH